MAQTGYTPLLIYASGTASNVPLAANLTSSASGAELALNYADGKLYFKNSSGVVTLLASSAGASGDVVGPASATDNALARFDLTTGKLIQNSVGILSDAGALSGLTDITASGNVTLSGGTANGVAYLNGSKVLTTGSALTFDGTNLATTGTASATKLIPTGGTATGNGVYLPSANTLGFSTNGVLNMSLDSSGNLIVGGTSALVSASGRGNITVNGSTDSILSFGSAGVNTGYLYATTSGMELASIGSTYVRFSTNGSERMRLDSSGNLGLGVTPSAWGSGQKAIQVGSSGAINGSSNTSLVVVSANRVYNGTNDLYINTAAATAYQQSSGAHAWFTAASGTAGNAITFTQAMTLDASGNLLVGKTSGTGYRFEVTGNGVFLSNTSAYAAYLGQANIFMTTGATTDFAIRSDANLLFGAGGSTERARITSGGYFKASDSGTYLNSTASFHEVRNTAGNYCLVASNTAASGQLGYYIEYTAGAPNGTGNEFLVCLDNAATRTTIRSNGGIANYSGNNVNLSDRREKTNFAPAKSYLDTICAIPVQTFNYIDQSEDDPGLTLGVVAQDVQAVAPELVMESNWGSKDDPRMRLSIYQTDLQYALMKCIQELKAEVDSLKSQLKGA
jgi:hypothetical protein